MHYLKIESWGYSLWRGGQQYGAGVGIDPFWKYAKPQTKAAARIYRKHGVLILS